MIDLRCKKYYESYTPPPHGQIQYVNIWIDTELTVLSALLMTDLLPECRAVPRNYYGNEDVSISKTSNALMMILDKLTIIDF